MLRFRVRRTAGAAALLAVALATASASAQGAPGANAADANAADANTASTGAWHWGRSAVGADAGILFPLGYPPLVGAVFKLEVGPAPSLGITGRIGYFYGPSKALYKSFSDLPIWIGLRDYPSGGSQGFHAGVEFGLNELFVRDDDYAGRPKIVNNGLFGANLPLGYRTGGLDIQLQLSMLGLIPLGGPTIGIMVGYDFGG